MVLKGQTSKLLKQLNIWLHKNIKYIIKTLKEPDSLSQHNSLWGSFLHQEAELVQINSGREKIRDQYDPN